MVQVGQTTNTQAPKASGVETTVEKKDPQAIAAEQLQTAMKAKGNPPVETETEPEQPQQPKLGFWNERRLKSANESYQLLGDTNNGLRKDNGYEQRQVAQITVSTDPETGEMLVKVPKGELKTEEQKKAEKEMQPDQIVDNYTQKLATEQEQEQEYTIHRLAPSDGKGLKKILKNAQRYAKEQLADAGLAEAYQEQFETKKNKLTKHIKENETDAHEAKKALTEMHGVPSNKLKPGVVNNVTVEQGTYQFTTTQGQEHQESHADFVDALREEAVEGTQRLITTFGNTVAQKQKLIEAMKKEAKETNHHAAQAENFAEDSYDMKQAQEEYQAKKAAKENE